MPLDVGLFILSLVTQDDSYRIISRGHVGDWTSDLQIRSCENLGSATSEWGGDADGRR